MPPFPNAQVGMGGVRTTNQTKGRRGMPRNVTEPDGTPKFGHPELEPAIFWWIFSKLPNIFCVGRPPFFPTPKWGRGECETTDLTKGGTIGPPPPIQWADLVGRGGPWSFV